MSYILDALKKSETDRQRSHAAGIADIPSRAPRAGTPAWVWLLSGLLLINAAAVAYLLLGKDGDPSPRAAVTVTTDTLETPGNAAIRAATGGNPPGSRPDAPAPAATPTATGPDANGQTPADVLPTARSPASPLPSAATPAADTSPSDTTRVSRTEALPASDDTTEATFMELRANGSIQTPDLHLDIHVYSETPTERFVFINMSKYREKERLAEGPVIREIIPNGVVLEQGRHRFLLPRE